MTSLLTIHLPALAQLFRKHRVLKAEVFGSATSDEFGPNSDIDLLVSFDPTLPVLDYADNYFELKEQLEILLGRRVDLVSSKSLKNPVLIQSIHRSKQSLYAA